MSHDRGGNPTDHQPEHLAESPAVAPQPGDAANSAAGIAQLPRAPHVAGSSDGTPVQRLSFRQRLHRALHPRLWKLPTLLVCIVVLLSAAGLVASAGAVNMTMRQVAVSNIDKDLLIAAHSWAGGQLLQPLPAEHRPPSNFYVYKETAAGAIVYNDSNISPDLSAITELQIPVTIPSVDAGQRWAKWRALAIQDDQSTTVVAMSLEPTRQLIVWLTLLETLIGLVVLVALALLAAFVVRRALRPLKELEDTATAIAAGDHERRVPTWPATTEVGQLSRALNVMLAKLDISLTQAEEKEAQMRRFVGDASHELRTPLTSLQGFAELYRSGAVSDPEYCLTRIEQEAQRMRALVEDLLALTRAEGQPLQLAPVDAALLIDDVAQSMRAAWPDRRITVTLPTDDPESLQVIADSDRLRQVVNNIVANALVHGGSQAQVTLAVEAVPESASRPAAVAIKISDDGIGMEQHDVDHIFERFYRADTSRCRSAVNTGNGLGLSIVRSLVLAHHGSIAVRSAVGEGSTFTVTIPCEFVAG
ncbi:ATP-binding protein [Corynebacterium choanae]|uniref:histidine kinase n=1 Tax=Corynebacterium choanae TaxID=1862358 RepID=A0A3G6J9S7_9CORY|nr:HAMP domain-containing sensor histidine kinase [Corynebacterium choanae]AZA12784.1 putative sensor histidine kinase TcrY [Corynebacterium choanae]